MDSPYKNKVDRSILNKVLNEFFENAPVEYDETVGISQKITDDYKVILGPWAGPEAHIENLFHEMAHLVEIDIGRMNQPGWGFKWGTYWQFGYNSGREFQTDQAVKREIRVWAIQAVLIKHYLGNVDLFELTKSAVWLSALPLYCRGTDAERLVKVKEEVEALTSKYPFEWFKAEWNNRMKILA